MANATAETTGSSAEEAAAAGAGELSVGSSSISETIMTQSFAPCPAGATGCGGSAGPPQADLTIGASANEVLDATQTALDLVGLLPVIGEPADAVSGVISFTRGDHVGAALSIGALIPFVGDAAGVAKITRSAGKAADVGSDLIKNVPRSKLINSTSKGSRVSNVNTDASPLGVARTLKANGFKVSRSLDRRALNFQKGEAKFSLRMNSKSTGSPTLDFFKGNNILRKIRLRQ